MIQVIDAFLPDPLAYRAACLAMPRRSHELGPDVVFHGIAEIPDRTVPDLLEARFPTLRVVTSLTRLSPLGQSCPNAIHQDLDMGTVTGILYLNPDAPVGDGTDFMMHRETGSRASTAQTLDERIEEGLAWCDPSQWDRWMHVAAQFNRLLLFDAALFHSRAIFENYGTDDESARLIEIDFCTGVCP